MLNVRRIFISLFTALVFSTPAFAAGVEVGVFDNNNNATINGVAINPSGRVSVSVFNIGKTASDAENLIENSIVFVNQINPEVDKTFSLPINMSKYGTGEYTLSVYQEGKKIEEKIFPFAKETDNLAAIEELNDIAQAAKVSGNIKSVSQFIQSVDTHSGILNRVRLECSSEYDESVTLDNAAKYITEQAPFADKEACVRAYKKAMLIAAFAENKISSIENVKQGIEILNQSPLKEVYASEYITGNVKLNLAAKISSLAPYNTTEEFDNAVKDALILTVVKYPTGSGDISSVISAVYPQFPKNLLTPAVCRSVANKSYVDMNSLRKAMEESVEGENNSSSGGGGGGGGGSAPMKPVTSAIAKEQSTSSINTTVIPSENVYFTDIDDVSWAAEAIKALAVKGIISGREENRFCPQNNITREEFVKMCVLLFKIPTNNVDLKFTDVNSDSWEYPYIRAAYGAGIINGVSETEFGVGSFITRQDAAVIINNCIKEYNLKYEDATEFADRSMISDYAKEAVAAMQKLQIISGYEDGCFYPKNNITRAEAAKMLFSTDERIEEV